LKIEQEPINISKHLTQS